MNNPATLCCLGVSAVQSGAAPRRPSLFLGAALCCIGTASALAQPGACRCLSTGCQVLTEADCLDAGGAFDGPGTSCGTSTAFHWIANPPPGGSARFWNDCTNWDRGFPPRLPTDDVYFDAVAGGIILSESVTVHTLHCPANQMTLVVDGHSLHVLGPVSINCGMLLLSGELRVDGSLTIESQGNLQMRRGNTGSQSAVFAPGTLTVQGMLQGSGTIVADVVNQGRIYSFARYHDPSGAPGTLITGGPLIINGNLTCTDGLSSSSILVQVQGTDASSHGLLTVAGNASLGNLLETNEDATLGHYNPMPNDRITIIQAGTFDTSRRFQRFRSSGISPTGFLALDHDYKNVRAPLAQQRGVELLGVSPLVRWSLGPSGTAHKAVLLTHGTYSSIGTANGGGFGEIAHRMAQFANLAGIGPDWDVYTLDWSQYSTSPWDLSYNPLESARIGAEIGDSLAQNLASSGTAGPRYSVYHLLSHSSGSWFVDRMADTLVRLQTPRPLIQLTLFDTYAPPGNFLGSIGESADAGTEQYVDRGCCSPPGTDALLPIAVNIDVSHAPDTTGVFSPCICGGTCAALCPLCCFGFVGTYGDYHAWPYKWYLNTIRPDLALPAPTCPSSAPGASVSYWGFPRSLMYADYIALNGGSQCTRSVPVGAVVLIPSGDSRRPPNTLAPLPFSGTNTTFGPSGTGMFGPMIPSLDLRTGSPIAATTSFSSAELVEGIQFNYEFQSQAQGRLSVALDGEQVFRADEQGTIGGINQTGFIPILPAAAAGPHTLVVFLDPGAGAQSHLVVSGFGYGRYVPPPCPADFNSVNGLNVQDIFDFLNAWFALDPRADFNGMNGITTQDIFDFLAAWFVGCP